MLFTAPLLVQDLCRTDPRGVQLLQALGEVQNPALAAPSFPALHSVVPPALASAVTIPRVLSSPSLPPLSAAATPRQAEAGWAGPMSSPPPASAAAAPVSATGAAAPRKRRKRGRTSGGTSPGSAAAAAAADAQTPGRAGKRSRPSPLCSPAAAAPSTAALPLQNAAPTVDSSGVARDLMALLAQQVPGSAGLAARVAAQTGFALGDSGASVAALAGLPIPAASGCAPPAHQWGPQDGGVHGVHAPGNIAPQESAVGGTRDGQWIHVYGPPPPMGVGAGNDGAVGVSLGVPLPAAAAVAAGAADGGAPLSPEQRTDLAHRLEAVFGGMGMDSATISAGLAIALGVNAGQAPGR